MKIPLVWCVCVFAAVATPCPTVRAEAQDGPAGFYRARAMSLELTPAGGVAIQGASGPLAFGSYRVLSDTIVLRDDSGPEACRGNTGTYVWRLNADTLSLQLVSDDCEMRRLAFAEPWHRVTEWMRPGGQLLQEVVITAERQSQDVQRTPLPITVLSAVATSGAGVTRPQDLASLVPGLLVGTMNGGSALTFLRGVGNLAATSLQDPTVTFNYDGVYIARPTSTSGLFYDLERVEVLKGPQGTLYGRNATGGAVNILPRPPELQRRAGGLASSFGSRGFQLVEGWLNVPVRDRTAVRVAAQRARHDPYLRDGSDDQDEWAGRLQLRFEPTEALTIRVGADYFDQGGTGTGATPLALGANRLGVASPEASAYYETRRVAIAGRTWTPTSSMRRWNDQQHGGTNAMLEYLSVAGTLTLIPAARFSDVDVSNSAVGNQYSFQERGRQKSLELRFASTPGRHLRALVGAFYFDEDIDHSSRPFNQFHFILQRYETATTSLAPFLRLMLELSDKLRLTSGARLTREFKSFHGSYESFSRLCPPVPTATCPNAQPFPGDIMSAPLSFHPDSQTATPQFDPATGTLTIGFRGTTDGSERYTRLTWRGAAEYDLTQSALLYGSYETGFKSGGFFFSNDSPVYRPEHVGAFTLGLKSRLNGYRLRANFELFDWQYRDQQVSKLSLDSRGVQNIRTENIGQASIRGLDTELEYVPGLHTQLSTTVQFLDARYDRYAFITTVPPITGCDVTPLEAPELLVDCSRRRAPYAPEWTVSLGASHGFFLGGGAVLNTNVRSRYQSATLVGLDFLAEQHQPPHWVLDGALTFTPASGRYTVGVFGRNITDRTVVSNTFVVPLSTFRPGEAPFVVGVMRPPRTVGVRVSSEF